MRTLIVCSFRPSDDVEQGDLARFMTGEDDVGHVGKCAHCGFRANGMEHVFWFARFYNRGW